MTIMVMALSDINVWHMEPDGQFIGRLDTCVQLQKREASLEE